MVTAAFTEAWEQLSQVQREAAKWESGSILVLAGPGSGKTRVLTCRIARLLDSTRDQRFRILCLTFTNKAADEMRTRIAQFVPDQESRLFVGTFHSFCADVLRQHGPHVNINPNFAIYSQTNDLLAVLNDAVEKAKEQNSVVSDRDKRTLPIIQRLKSLLVMPSDCRARIRDSDLAERMAVVYPAYEAELAKRNAADFESLILRTYELFTRFPAFARRYHTVYPYLCVDEFQDTNEGQYRLMRLLTQGEPPDVFVVADDDQIIYQWNGASHQRIEQFTVDYSPQVLQLPMNYRCPPEIVRLANNLIKHNFLRTPQKKPLTAFRKDNVHGVVRLLGPFPNSESEAAAVAEDIEGMHAREFDSVTVLGRSRRLLLGAQRALEERGVPAVIAQRKDDFVSPPIVWLYSMLRLANDRQSSTALEAVCGSFAQLTHIEVDPHEVIAAASASTRDYLRQWVREARQHELGVVAEEAVREASQRLGDGADFKGFSEWALRWLDRLAQQLRTGAVDRNEEGFAGWEEERNVWDLLSREISASLGGDVTLESFLQELQMHSKEAPLTKNTVALMTIHVSKGKEFEHVYLIGLVDDEMPSFQSKKKGDRSPEMEEERRNCFVAITRAKNTLTLSYAQQYNGWPKKPSRFLYEMGLLKV